MSLRLRLLLVVSLALIALGVAALALVDIVRDSRAALFATVGSATEAAVGALARAYRDAPLGDPPRDPDARAQVRARAAGVLEPILDTRGGYCWSDGDFVEAESGSFRHDHGPDKRPRRFPPDGPPPSGDREGEGPPSSPGDREGPPSHPGDREDPPSHPGDREDPPSHPPRSEEHGPPGPPPDVRAALERACQRATTDTIDRQDVARQGETTVLVVAGIRDGVAAFAMRIVPGPPARKGIAGWFLLAAMPLVTLVMVGVMVDTIFALRRGVRDLGGTLVRLEQDLRADVPRPRAKELAEIADQLRTLASRLADARDRERVLERRVAHQARLGALGRLVAGVAHEIRNPLTGIKLLLDGLRRRSLDARSEKDVHTCLAEVARLDQLVTTFLGIARDAHTEPEAIDLGGLVDERIAALAELCGSRTVRAVRRGTATVVAERNVLLQILDNLVRNAIEASPPEATVDVLVSGDEEQVQIDVVDRGDGVPEKLADNLFEPFFTSKPTGTGLGLWLSHTAATSRGGGLRYGRNGGETHFTLTVPVQPR
jgi:signal transduction histidine kinase